MRRSITILTAFLFSCYAPTAVADDEGLYGKNAPSDAAFLRVFNASESSTLNLQLEGAKSIAIAPLSVTQYGFTESAEFSFLLNGKKSKLPAPAKSITTLIWNEDNTYSITEEAFSNKKKARLRLFNIGAPPITLKTEDGSKNVIENVKNQHYGYRDINALNIAFSFFEGDTNILKTRKLGLKKGICTSLFLVKKDQISIYVAAETQR